MGRISARNYEKMSAKYVNEQSKLEQRVALLQQEQGKSDAQEKQVADFAALIAGYAGIRELSKALLFMLIEDILVHEVEEDESRILSSK